MEGDKGIVCCIKGSDGLEKCVGADGGATISCRPGLLRALMMVQNESDKDFCCWYQDKTTVCAGRPCPHRGRQLRVRISECRPATKGDSQSDI